jgi:cytochrome P450
MKTNKSERYATIIPMGELDTAEIRLHPFPIYNKLRHETPIRFDDDRNCWDVFRYEDVHRILKDTAGFSSNRGLTSKDNESILTMDPPRHAQMRAIVNKAFTPKVINNLEPHIASITNELLDAVLDAGKMDMVTDLAVPLPVIVIAELLGVPSSDRKLFKEWSDTLVKGPNENSDAAFAQVMAEKGLAINELNAYFIQIIEQCRKHPKEDLISLLLTAEIDGQRLSDKEIISFAILLLAAGNETTTNLLTNAVRCLTEHNNVQQKLWENPELLSGFIEEVLRFYPPIQALGRVASSDIEISGHLIHKGDQVVSWLASANRDENKFPNPDAFLIDRKPNNHLSFGFGIHFCLGAPLARLEAQIALSIMIKRMRNLQYVHGEQLHSIQSPFVYGVKQFPITCDSIVWGSLVK